MLTDMDRYIMWSCIGFFNITGLFGNFHVIYAHYRLPALRTKYGILLSLLVASQSVCLLYEWVGVAYAVSGVQIVRSTCFRMLAPYVFMHCVQSGLMAAISTDLLLSIVIPIRELILLLPYALSFRHRLININHYLLLYLVPIVIYGMAVLVTAIVNMDDKPIAVCQPPLSLPYVANRLWYFVALILNIIVVLTYISTFALIKKRSRTKKRVEVESDVETKALKSLSLLLLVFVCTRFFSTAVSNIMNFAGASREAIDWAHGYAIIPALTCYSSTFYVCIIRSREYRRIFSAQIADSFAVFGIQINRHFLYSSHGSEYSLRYRSNRIESRDLPRLLQKSKDDISQSQIRTPNQSSSVSNL